MIRPGKWDFPGPTGPRGVPIVGIHSSWLGRLDLDSDFDFRE